MSEREELPHVVIIGGGFGGVRVARRLKRAPVRVTLVDRRNHHLFQPLLYQVATAGLSGPDIAYPIRKMFRRQRNCSVYLGEVTDIDRRGRTVTLSDGERLTFDHLVVATGVGHDYFGHDEAWSPWAPGLKHLDEALDIRRRVLLAYEEAEREPDPERRAALLTFVVVGAGPTGVEMAGALAEIARKTLARDFRKVTPDLVRVVLVDAAPRVLGAFDQRLSDAAQRQLERLGVQVELARPVTGIDADGVHFDDGLMRAHVVIWAAGVRAVGPLDSLGAERDRGGRVHVTDRLHLPNDERVYVIGDAAHLEQDGAPLPGVAQVAMQMGQHAAANIRRAMAGEPQTGFRYKDKGSLATIGRSKAVAQLGRFRLSGFFAWFLWVWIHILFLVGFRNRFVVFWEWIWAYFTYTRSARVILERPFRAERARPPTAVERDGNGASGEAAHVGEVGGEDRRSRG